MTAGGFRYYSEPSLIRRLATGRLVSRLDA